MRNVDQRPGKYLHSLPDTLLCDYVLLIDAFDALILEPEEKLVEIVSGMEQKLEEELRTNE